MATKPFVQLEGPDGPIILAPGDLIGRGDVCALRLDDPHVSEANALVSLRGGGLVLLRLRGHLAEHPDIANPADAIALHGGGQVVRVGKDVDLKVMAVTLPGDGFAVESSLLAGRHRLEPPEAAIVVRNGRGAVVVGHPDDAVITLSYASSRWSARHGALVVPTLRVNKRWSLDAEWLRLVPHVEVAGTRLVAPSGFKLEYLTLNKVELTVAGVSYSLHGRGWAYFHHFASQPAVWEHYGEAMDAACAWLGIDRPTKSAFHKARTAMHEQLAACGVRRPLFEKNPMSDGTYRFKAEPGEEVVTL